jgi:UTRA domain-containing protein
VRAHNGGDAVSRASRTRTAWASPGPGGLYARLDKLGHRLDHFDEEIRARMPAPDEGGPLQLASGVPVTELPRTVYDTEGRAVEVCAMVLAADAYVLAYQLPQTALVPAVDRDVRTRRARIGHGTRLLPPGSYW